MSASCKVCGCTDDRACPGGCAWVKVGLCSACLQVQLEGLTELAIEWTETAGEPILDRIPGTLGTFPCFVAAEDGQISVRDHLGVVAFSVDREGAYLALQYEAAEIEATFRSLIDKKEAA